MDEVKVLATQGQEDRKDFGNPANAFDRAGTLKSFDFDAGCSVGFYEDEYRRVRKKVTGCSPF